MKDKYSHRERIEIIVAGKHPDRFAASFWRHFFHLENNASGTADGLFYATTHWASSDKLTFAEYERFGIPYDLKVIKNSQEGALNLLHVCGSNNYLAELAGLDYRFQLCNWDDSDPTNLSLLKADEALSGKVMVGGVEQNGWLLNETPNQVIDRILDLKRQHDPCRLVIGPGCVVAPEVPAENLMVIRENL